ncbi:TetR/AcrR family transcriptional regulator [Devosia sediminis]|uniref:TetR family transcriptional regulator n=1 Tax=Devosia sediminis TaxID=2798801 RepID=A0A934IV99_9HYPH|nr:TetR/AcrR family transcriptional regulator [Devosia sediminis]MBJ3785766.1 TetR family transcriptional regulator [Devosia sediminis]
MTSSAYSKKKQPELVRQALLDEALRLAMSSGPEAVTIQAVAAGAGVTKGGLFHHFPSKQALIEGMVAHVFAQLDLAIDRYLQTDSGRGCFTRAYVETILVDADFGPGSPMDVLNLSVVNYPIMGPAWDDWIARRMDRHNETDNHLDLEILRYAADGAWLSHLGTRPEGKFREIRDRLVALSRE